MRMRLLSCLAMLVVTGCAARGPGTIVSPTSATAAGSTGTVAAFAAAYAAAQSDPSTTASANAYNMVRIGTELQYQLCADFFRSAGKEQQWLLFAKDALATIGTVTTGILGASGGSATAIAWVGLSAAAGITGINVYARNFLFSEDNVQAVQDLTLKALSAARDVAVSPSRKDAYTFSSGVSALMDVQAVCEVQNILVMVRKAIGNATPVASGSEVDVPISSLVRARLGDLLANGAPVSRDQLAALYRLYIYPIEPTDAQRKALVGRLRGLNPSPLTVDGQPNPDFARKVGQVTSILEGLPSSVASQLSTEIMGKEGAGAGNPAPAFARGGGSIVPSAPTPGRIGIEVR